MTTENKDNSQNKTNREITTDIHIVKKRVYVKDYIMYVPKGLTENDRFKNVSVKEILKIWGYDHFYIELINHFDHCIDNNPYLDIVFYYDSGEFTKDSKRQKLLGFCIWDWKNDKSYLTGGALFQNNELSFHT